MGSVPFLPNTFARDDLWSPKLVAKDTAMNYSSVFTYRLTDAWKFLFTTL